MVKKIKFLINKDGEITLSVEGVQGRTCEAMSEAFEEALGCISKKEYKDSFYLEEISEDQEIEGLDNGES